MFLNAKNCVLTVNNWSMDYITFGYGNKALIIMPGVSDGLSTVKGSALSLALRFKMFIKDYKVYVFSRRNELVNGCNTRDMAKDQIDAMKVLSIDKAVIMGISQGGMIAQYIAIDYPEFVDSLILTVTSSRQNEYIQRNISKWIEFASQNNYGDLMIDSIENSYSDAYIKKHKFLYPLLRHVGKPKDFNRFIIQAQSCISHNSYNELDKIACPTLVIGGDKDKIVGPDSSIEISNNIKNSKLILYSGLGHGTYDEAHDFCEKILEFLSNI